MFLNVFAYARVVALVMKGLGLRANNKHMSKMTISLIFRYDQKLSSTAPPREYSQRQ